jgi:hypothetical protein
MPTKPTRELEESHTPLHDHQFQNSKKLKKLQTTATTTRKLVVDQKSRQERSSSK